MKKYQLRGRYRDADFKGELECSKNGELREIEFEDVTSGSFLRPTECSLTDLSAEVIDHMGALMADEREGFEPARVVKGTWGQEPAYKVKGKSSSWYWEFEVTEAGRLLELEKDARKGH